MRCSTVLFCVAAASAVVAVSGCDVRCQFDQWKTEHGRRYETASEESRRFENFQANLVQIEKLSRENPMATFGTNKFSDLSPSEMSSTYMNKRPDQNVEEKPLADSETVHFKRALPTDYSAPITVAKDQGQCGSCWAFAACGAMEAAWKRYNGGAVIDLSEQQEVDCNSQSSGCNGGGLVDPIQYGIKNGMMSESSYKYTGRDGSCRFSSGSVIAKFTDYFTATFNEAVGSGVDVSVYNKGALVMAIDASTMQNYRSGILSSTSGCKQGTNHAVLLYGWGVEGSTKYWRVKNSWGATWGEGGNFRIVRGSNACLITEEKAVGVVPASGNNPPQSSVVPDPSSGGCKPTQTCGTRVCGTIDNGCGTAISCGKCATGETCSAEGQCIGGGGGGDDNWVQFYPSGHSTDFTVQGSTVSTTGSYTGEKRIAWASSESLVSTSLTRFSASVSASTSGSVGLGMRLQSDNSGLFYKLNLGGRSNSVSLCKASSGTSSCQRVGSGFSWPRGATKTFAVEFGMTSDQRYITMSAFLDGEDLLDGYYRTSASSFPQAGRAFVVASGTGKTFANLAISSRSSLHMTLEDCVVPSELRARIARMLHVDWKIITDLLPYNFNGSCPDFNAADPDSAASGFNFNIWDSEHVSLFGEGPYPAGRLVPSHTSSSVLAQRVQQMTSQGYFANNGITVSSVTPVIPEFVGTAMVATFAASAALGAGAIAGIVIGSVAAAAVVAGAAVGGVVLVKKMRKGKDPKPEATGVSLESNPTSPRKAGVNVMGLETTQHASITSRAPPSISN